MAHTEIETDVLVVGAGPTGLMLANWLAALGVRAELIDGKEGPTRESRALVVQARSMEIYDQLGLADVVLAQAAQARWLAPGFGPTAFGRIALGEIGRGLTPYPRIYVLEQSKNEQILLDGLRRRGGDVRWRHRLTALTGDGPVEASVDAPDGPLRIRARFCVGADGGSSLVRQLRGIDFEGTTNDQTFYVLDATAVRGLVGDAVNVRPGDEDFLLAFPMGQPADFRLIGIVEEGENPEEETRERLDQVFGVTYGASRWYSTYRISHRLASGFRDGPVFLAGDAAHVHSPVGAQGMNTGLQDAHNLAFKLADVLAGRAPEESLDRYEAERRPVAERLVRTTDAIFGLVTSRKPFARLVRRRVPPVLAPVAVRVLPRLSGVSRFFGYVSQIRIHYRMPGQPAGRRGHVVGRRLPWTGENFEALAALTWQVHAYGSVDATARARLKAELGVEVMRFGVADRATGLREGLLYLVRPDGFVAMAATADVAVEAFRRVLPGPPTSHSGGPGEHQPASAVL